MPRNAPFDITIVGANQLDDLAKKLKAAGETGKGLRKELLKGLREGAKPLKVAVKESAEDVLPHRIAVTVKKGVSIRTRATGRQAGVRVIAKRGRGLNDGRLRHPLFGNRKRWFQQDIKKGWFTTPLEEGAPEVRKELLKVIDHIAKKLES
jgi:hypothetical protein